MKQIKILLSCLVLSLVFATIAQSEIIGTAVTISAKSICNNGFIQRNYTACPPNWIEAALPPSSTGAAHLAFSDLISGPDTGLGDGNGSGVIVTVWGYNLGATQDTSVIEYCDSTDTCRSGHVYYWKNADGQLPSGPANLFESHGMQEIAFSIPDSAQGDGFIRVTVNGDQSWLPFAVRSGSIYHVAGTGNDSTGDGSYANPWATTDAANTNISTLGPTVYLRGVNLGMQEISPGSETYAAAGQVFALYFNTSPATSDLANQAAFVAFPNTATKVVGTRGVEIRNEQAVVVSKLTVLSSSSSSVDANGQPSGSQDSTHRAIRTSKDGRIIANYIADIPGWCADGSSGAINGNYSEGTDYVSNVQIFGNEIEDYSCYGANKLHHTTYLSIRSGPNDYQIPAPRFGWNYLHGNEAKNGIHLFDQNTDCGDFTTDIIINDNVIVDQAGSAISMGLSGCTAVWNAQIYNNVAINAGLAAAWDGLNVETADGPDTGVFSIWTSGFAGSARFFNNTAYTWNTDDMTQNTRACLGFAGGSREAVDVEFFDNVCYTDRDNWFVRDRTTGGTILSAPNSVSGVGNLWFTTVGSPTNANVPAFDTSALTGDPLLTRTGNQLSLGSGSPAENTSTTNVNRTVYGDIRGPASNKGAL